MASKRFRINCLVRIVLTSLTGALCLYLLAVTTLYTTIIVIAALALAQGYALLVFVERSNRDMVRFLEAIEYDDLSDDISTGLRGHTFDELNASFARVLKRFRAIRQEREENHWYLETVIQQVGTGLIAFRDDGVIELANAAARRILRVARLDHIDECGLDADLISCLRNARPGQRQVVTLRNGSGPQQISVLTTQLRLTGRNITLASLQNITSELSAKELEAWQNIIRVLAHEIRNSLTPVGSLAATIADSLDAENTGAPTSHLERHEVREALVTIQRRSEGLLNFVDSYRRLTRLPAPTLATVPVSTLLSDAVTLLQAHLPGNEAVISCLVEPVDLTIQADAQLIGQVLTNLSLNAVEALSGQPNGQICFRGVQDGFGRVRISVTDNGPGIVPEALDRIFVPFYTTKKSGSGIGLSLSRQIMRMHHGQLTVSSVPHHKTTFTLLF